MSHKKYFTLQSSKRTDIAVLNMNISRCFRDLESRPSVVYEGFVNMETWKDQIRTWNKTGKAGIISIDINVYGSRHDLEAVGKVFSNTRFYFQHLHHWDGTVKYENPHYLSFPNISDARIDGFSASVASIRAASTLPVCDMLSVFESLHQHEYLRQTEVDRRIETPLRRFVSLPTDCSL